MTGRSLPLDALPGSMPLTGATPDPVVSAVSTGSSAEAEVTVDQVSLARRLRQPRTIVSLVLPIILLLLAIQLSVRIDVEQLVAAIAAANPLLLLAAVGVYYLGFPLRGLRWTILLRGAGYRVGVSDSTEIIFLSWLVNCLIPAKLGDVYRAYLLKLNSPVSLSRTFGTVFIERALDLFAIVILGLAAGYVSFRTGMPPAVQFVFALGLATMLMLAVGLMTMRNFGRRLLVRLPLPHGILELYDRFEIGVFGAIRRRDLPGLVVLTGLIWATEAGRLLLVIAALGFDDVHLGISGAFFVALIASLLTAVPLTPAGIGIVEAGIFGLLTVVYNVPPTEAATIALVDRAISVLSVIVTGSIAYVVSGKRRGAGMRVPVVAVGTSASLPEPG
ncbi:MAG TPA: lysylphosphatidylglycerol synthase transmembrane domain-containing protein [Candidatus Limnocylindrales bacterium]|nr:lysylphosphatidylglycerol synthase transmembrane domain-containing protein [Candidatus Limnocylindrales bacterium]